MANVNPSGSQLQDTNPDEPWPPVLQTPVGQTVSNYISYCRKYHTWAFFVYLLLLVIVIALVWVAQNGTLSYFNSAVGCTIAIAICAGLMFVHWYWFIKGVIPECPETTITISTSVGAKVTTASAPKASAPKAAPVPVAEPQPTAEAPAPSVEQTAPEATTSGP